MLIIKLRCDKISMKIKRTKKWTNEKGENEAKMGLNAIIYIAEIGIIFLSAIIGAIIIKARHKKGVFKLLGICLVTLIIALGATFIIERPEMHIKDVTEIEINSGVIAEKPNTNYHFQNVTDKVNIKGNIDYNKIGEYDVKYEINTIIGKYSKNAKIKVVDKQAPNITLQGDENYKQSYKQEYSEPGFSVIDNADGDISSKVITSKEIIDATNYKIIYSVEDSSGNKAQKVRNVAIVDDIPPVITLNGNSNIEILINTKYQESGAKAEDEKDGDLTDKIETSGTVDTSKEGTYTITYKVKDNSGNEATQQRTVVVKKQIDTANNVNNKENKQTNTTQPVSAPVYNNTSGKKGVIYLTFDDGPSSNITPKVLDILKQKGVKATFFILNYNATGEQLVQRAYSEGHTIAIHGYSHDYAQIYKSEEAYMSNITKLQEKIRKTTGYNATITRFPGGSSNTISKKYNQGIMTRLTKLVVQKGYKYFDWNVSSGDAGGASNSDQVYYNVINGLSKSKANVVLMHDFSSNQKLLNALPRIIDYGLQNGYTFERITESTPMVTHRPNN